jgi:hypothetical protein
MATAAIPTARPSPSLMARLTTPRALLVLILLMWVPLTLHVMFGNALGAARNIVLLINAMVDLACLFIKSDHKIFDRIYRIQQDKNL